MKRVQLQLWEGDMLRMHISYTENMYDEMYKRLSWMLPALTDPERIVIVPMPLTQAVDTKRGFSQGQDPTKQGPFTTDGVAER